MVHSPDDQTLDLADTRRHAIWAVRLAEPGVLLRRRARLLTDLPGGRSGGEDLAVAEPGHLDGADVKAGEVMVTPQGQNIGAITRPAGGGTLNTKVACGGPDRRTLSITEAGQDVIDREQRHVQGRTRGGDQPP